MIRTIGIATLFFLGLALGASSAFAQLPSVQGQMPGTLAPAPPVIAPPPPVAPPPVPSVVTPIPSPGYGVPPGVTGRMLGSGSVSIYRTPAYRPPKKRKRFRKRNPRVSEIGFVRAV